MIDKIKARIEEIEAAMQQLVQNHATLSGHLAEAKVFLDMATKAAEEIAPEEPVSEALAVVDEIVDEVVPE